MTHQVRWGIRRVNRQAVLSITDLRRNIDEIGPGDALALEVNRLGNYSYVAFERNE
jgi:hypothetical protein